MSINDIDSLRSAMDEDDGDVEIVDQADDTPGFHMQVWQEELSDAQKAQYETQLRNYDKFKLLEKGLKERRVCDGVVELWLRKSSGTKSSEVGVPSLVGTQIFTSNSGRTNFNQLTSLNTRPQLTSIRTAKTVVCSSANFTQSVLQRNTVQSGNTAVRPATSMVPVQQFPNLLFDTNSGLLIMPTSQTSVVSQPIAIRPAGVRQPISSTPRAVTSLVTTRLVNSTPIVASVQSSQMPIRAGAPRAYHSPTLLNKASILQPKMSVTPKTITPILQSTAGPAILQRGGGGLAASMPKGAAVPTNSMRLGATNGISTKEEIKSNKPAGSVMITKVTSASDNKASVNGVEKSTIMNGSSSSSSSDSNNNSKTFPSLVVNVKPCLQEKPPRQEINSSRAELDQLVKNALVYAPSRFTEWLMQKGLLRLEHKCFLHKGEDGQPVQFKLGMYSDKDKEPFSGGYVWISDCCSGRQISVYDGSIFDSSHHPPTTLLKLIYHWACQTSAANVLNWCKVSGGYLKNFYTLLRSVCVGALHELCPKMGGAGKSIEVGIITLGTTLTAATGRKQVKIEILGVFDPETKMIRMKLVNPQQSSSSLPEPSKSRGVQILSPLNIWVDKASTILFDGSIEQDLLIDMGFKNLTQCQNPPENPNDPKSPTNANVMNYLKHVVPKMFQNTLCVLSKSLIQQFLDELSWREKWGVTPSSAFENILEHIKLMTNWDFGPNGNLVAWLNKISMNPFQDWSYSRLLQPSGIDLLPDSIRQGDTMPALSSQLIDENKTGSSGLTLSSLSASNARSSASSKPPVLLPQVPTLTVANGPLKRKLESSLGTINLMEYFLKQPKSIALESYYYAELPSVLVKDAGGEFPQNVKCPLCSKPFFSNTEVYRHIYSHVHAIGRAPSSINFCNYCLKDVTTSLLPVHIQDCHKMVMTEGGFACRICQERFSRESTFVIHMWENHCEADTPYACELCDYRSSFHYQVVDHYNQSHQGTDTVLCPTCMKILPAKSHFCLKQITVHIQTHQMRKGKKCPHCCLVFSGDAEYRSHVIDGAHKARSTTSRKVVYYNSEENGLQMAKPPIVPRAMLLQTPIKKPKTSASLDTGKKPQPVHVTKPATPTTMENMYTIREHYVSMNGVGQGGCLECSSSIDRPEHFPGFMSCIKCRFATCCKSAMRLHHASAHPAQGKGRKNASMRVKNTGMMDSPLLCACGFETINPNRLARHLALCDKITAYPLDWEEQLSKRAGQPAPEPLTPLDHLEMMRDPSR